MTANFRSEKLETKNMTKRKLLLALGTTAFLIPALLIGTQSLGSRLSPDPAPSPKPGNSVTISEDSEGEVTGGRIEKGDRGTAPSVTPGVTPSPPDIPNFVRVEAPEHESWGGETCRPPRRGSLCHILFQGGVHTKQESAVVHFLAFENGRSEPAMHHEFPIKQGMTQVNTRLPYQIGEDADWVELRVELRDLQGNVLATNFPQRIPITVPSE